MPELRIHLVAARQIKERLITEEIQAANLLDMRNVGAQLMTSGEYMRGDEIIDNLDYVRSRMKAAVLSSERLQNDGSDIECIRC